MDGVWADAKPLKAELFIQPDGAVVALHDLQFKLLDAVLFGDADHFLKHGGADAAAPVLLNQGDGHIGAVAGLGLVVEGELAVAGDLPIDFADDHQVVLRLQHLFEECRFPLRCHLKIFGGVQQVRGLGVAGFYVLDHPGSVLRHGLAEQRLGAVPQADGFGLVLHPDTSL